MPDLTLEAFEDMPRNRLEELLRLEAKNLLGRLPAPMVTGPGACLKVQYTPAFGTQPALLKATPGGEEEYRLNDLRPLPEGHIILFGQFQSVDHGHCRNPAEKIIFENGPAFTDKEKPCIPVRKG
jgi:hypothetical protein